MEAQKQEQKQEQKVKLFREKSLESVESPESLNDYLKVTSAGVWMMLAAVILVLVGGIIWCVFGQIETRVNIAVSAKEGQTVCYVPYEEMEAVMKAGSITVEGQECHIREEAGAEMVTVTEEMSPYLRLAGGLKAGDMVVQAALDAAVADGVYSGTVVTENLHPMELLLK